MAKQISEDIAVSVRDLIKQITGFEEGTETFDRIQKHILTTLKKSDTMYFLNKRQVDENIAGMAEKFNFHGFFPQAKALQNSYKAYIPETLPKSKLFNRLNIVKLLLCLSERPTYKFLDNLEKYKTEPKEEEEEEINWAEYLNEGIEPWTPNFDESSDDSDTSPTKTRADADGCGARFGSYHIPVVIDEAEKGTVMDLRTNREELLATIQHTWYNQERFHMAPFSEWREANIGILWDKYLEDQVKGLIPVEKSSVLSEYKVIREILWQLWCLHTSCMFEIVGDKIRPKSNVTISSVRAEALETFLYQFIPYMEVLDYFRKFSKSLVIDSEENLSAIPATLRSYNNSLQNILRPVYKRLSALEDVVREQDVTYTLLNLCHDLEPIFEPVMVLKKIHDEIVIDFIGNGPVKCATFLLCALHDSLRHSASKLEQDLRLTLYLESLYHYFKLVDSWLMKDDLSDYSGEFVILNKNKVLRDSTFKYEGDCNNTIESRNWMLNFELSRDLDDLCENDGIMKIITGSVLQIGRNLHLMRQLGKFSLINSSMETIHEEFVRKCLEQLERFYKNNVEEVDVKKSVTQESFYDCPGEKKFKYPVVCTEDCRRPTEFDRLENLVDTSDGFLMLAFEEYFVEPSEQPKPPQETKTLFEKISETTLTMFPTSNFFEKILNDLLHDRFIVSGLTLKKILIEEYLLEKQFQFLRHIFLFSDDMIFPFYRRLFERTNEHNRNWGNHVWLTTHLQDILMDAYPEFYDQCLVQVKDSWRLCRDSLDACNMVSVQYKIRWPLDMIISDAHMALYRDVFDFVMRIKWALYTVNHLSFTDLEPKIRCKRRPTSCRDTIMRLKYLKFALTNVVNSVQHYLFSFVFSKCLQKFELEFERANDLFSIMMSHANFINTIYMMVLNIKQLDRNFPPFKDIIDCVKLLRMMWKDLSTATPQRLLNCYRIYRRSYSAIEPIICPVYIFDY